MDKMATYCQIIYLNKDSNKSTIIKEKPKILMFNFIRIDF